MLINTLLSLLLYESLSHCHSTHTLLVLVICPDQHTALSVTVWKSKSLPLNPYSVGFSDMSWSTLLSLLLYESLSHCHSTHTLLVLVICPDQHTVWKSKSLPLNPYSVGFSDMCWSTYCSLCYHISLKPTEYGLSGNDLDFHTVCWSAHITKTIRVWVEWQWLRLSYSMLISTYH